MASLYSLQNANERALKRSFTAATATATPVPEQSTVSSIAESQSRKVRQPTDGIPAQTSGLRERNYYSPKMPSTAGPRMYENHIPSFMSIYGMDSVVTEKIDATVPPRIPGAYRPQEQRFPQPEQRPEQQNLDGRGNEADPSQIHGHQYRESTSTTSDSTDSSPTTTISTVDSSSLSDPSPSSSPESPITLVPLSSFGGTAFGLDNFPSLKMAEDPSTRLPLSDERPMTSPSPRKFKNPKSLALNLNPSAQPFQASEPSSPSFIKPPALKPRKKPSILSLNTGSANTHCSIGEALASPKLPSMLQRRSLKHSVSSPQMLSTPSFGPAGGMTLGGPSRFKESNLATNTFTISEDTDSEAPAGVQMATRIPGVTVGGDSFDRPHTGEDAKSPSYPEGPIMMYEPSVHLYSEPKAEEAMKFDVVINVAREVKNPLIAIQKGAEETTPSTDGEDFQVSSPSSDIVPDTAATMLSFRTAFEVQPSGSTESSPTTPRPSTEPRMPEYIHVPWDHNTDVKDELWDLCQTIDARVKEGKKVLVHCQQGASRSATLIIAYGMYINPELGATEAYAQAQAKSRWVNPNMSLLFSLNDFKKIIDQKRKENNTTVRKPSVKHRPTLSADATETPATPSRARGNSTPSAAARDNARSTTETGSEAPNSDPAAARFADFDFGFGEKSIPYRPSQSVPPAPPRQEADWEALMSPRVTEMTQNPLESFSRSLGAATAAPPPSEPFSPLGFDFPRASFFPPPAQRMSLAVDEDPRSPPTKGEAPITRSIDDFL